MNYAQILREVLELESKVLLDAIDNIDKIELRGALQAILKSKGKLVLTGVGKSGHIAQKIAATMSSTGTPSVFLHPIEAMHGDFGLIQKDDVILAISYSGESAEILHVLPHIKRFGNTLITMSSNQHSSLSKVGDFFLNIHVVKEACPLNIAPTSSTTLTLALGDALAICLMRARKFNKNDFASFHPGGSLGKRLFVKISDLMQNENLPIVTPHMSLKDCLPIMSQGRLGNVLVVESNKLVAVFSDGDLRRAISKSDFDINEPVINFASKNPKTCDKLDMLAIDALRLIEKAKIQLLVVVDKDEHILGVLHLHTLLSAGIK